MIDEISSPAPAPNVIKIAVDVEKLQSHASNITFSYEKMLDGYIELREVFAFEECLGDQLDEYFTQIEGFIKGIQAAANIILNADI